MISKPLRILVSILLLLIIAGAVPQPVLASDALDPGPVLQADLPFAQVIQAFALDDGSVAYLELRRIGGSAGPYQIGLTTIETDGLSYPVGVLPGLYEERPESVQVTACGTTVHVFATWENRLRYYRWQLWTPLAACRDYQIFLPALDASEPQ